MINRRDRTVYQNEEGKWANKRNNPERASSLHDRQKEAIRAAKSMLRIQGGGELTTMGKDGKIRSKETIAPGRDPIPPRDGENLTGVQKRSSLWLPYCADCITIVTGLHMNDARIKRTWSNIST